MHNSIKDKVLELCDIVDVVGERVTLVRKGKDFMGLCPFHPDHTPSMSVSPRKQIFKCFACGAGGDVIKFVQMRDRLDFRDALAQLARRVGLELGDDRQNPEHRAAVSAARDSARKTLAWAATHFQRNLREHGEGPAALDYARRRGLSEETIERFGVGLAPDGWDDLVRAATRAGIAPDIVEQAGLVASNDAGRVYDRFRQRLMFPIHDGQGRVVAFGGRTLGDDSAKYLNSPETALFSKSRILYGLHLAREVVRPESGVIIVEGYLDAVLLHQHGFTNTVATLGTALTDAHVKLLRPLTETLYLCFDSDNAGVKAADRAIETALRNRVAVRVVLLRPGEDPADCVVRGGSPAFSEILQRSVDALEFKWSCCIEAIGVGQSRGRRAAAESFLQFVASVSAAGGIDPLEQGLLIGRLSDLLGLPAGTIHELLAHYRGNAWKQAATAAATIAGSSCYKDSLRGLPAGLVTAVENVFGLVLNAPEQYEAAREPLRRAAPHCDAWARLFALCEQLSGELGGFTREELLGHCDDAELCELVGWAADRAGHVADDGGALPGLLDDALRTLAADQELIPLDELRGQLRGVSGSDARGAADFAALLAGHFGQHGLLSTGKRRAAAPVASRET